MYEPNKQKSLSEQEDELFNWMLNNTRSDDFVKVASQRNNILAEIARLQDDGILKGEDRKYHCDQFSHISVLPGTNLNSFRQ